MEKAILNYYALNGTITPVREFSIPAEGFKVYEVVRIIKGTPLFMEMHINRLTNSMEIAKVKSSLDIAKVTEIFYKVIEANGNIDGNIKLIINFYGDKENYYVYYIPHSYPEEKLYKEGIHTVLYNGERNNPNAKVINATFRKVLDEQLKENNAYEALLVDKHGRVTEGSKSNVFFVRNNILITPPLEQVLPGVTRAKILEIAKENNIEVQEKYINKNELKEYQGAFISGTSPKVLPIKSIDSIKICSSDNFLVKKIMKLYDNKIDKYINN
ncbi:aminotransferase class IV [Alloiococcus sp. CFN-8]|uniref:aminotransferase class IV n=1 Tax=Alloiococcus sp. CFN-8 TaxID=3416081 RepID=UPI003CED2AC5